MIVYTLIAGYWHKIRLQLEAENNGWDFTTVFTALSGVKRHSTVLASVASVHCTICQANRVQVSRSANLTLWALRLRIISSAQRE